MSRPDANQVHLPERAGETDEERRLREAINDGVRRLMRALDAAIDFHKAPAAAKRARHMARGDLLAFALKAQHAQAVAKDEQHSPHEA
ncbi:MAG: hypothetical protein AAF674_16950 [Pseudomonadota bacterium]